MAFEKYQCLLLAIFVTLLSSCQANTFNVGGRDGWTLHPSEPYAQWSGRLRFIVNDVLHFRYNGGSDSVLVVNKPDYDNCNIQTPITTLTGGDSFFTVDRTGPFYFISGNKSNCDQGQKLTVVVISPRTRTPPPAATPPSPPTFSPAPTVPPVSAPSGTPVLTPPATSPVGSISPPAGSPGPAPSDTPSLTPPAGSPFGSISPTAGSPASAPSDTPSLTPPASSPGGPVAMPPASSPGGSVAMPPGGTNPADVNAPPPAGSPSPALTATSSLSFAFIIFGLVWLH